MAYTVNNSNSVRIDPSKENTTEFTYSQQATIISDEAYHGGGDVAVYAIGIYIYIYISMIHNNQLEKFKFKQIFIF